MIWVRIVCDREKRWYETSARLTRSHVVTEAGLRFSRRTGKETGVRPNRRHWCLDRNSLAAVAT